MDSQDSACIIILCIDKHVCVVLCVCMLGVFALSVRSLYIVLGSPGRIRTSST